MDCAVSRSLRWPKQLIDSSKCTDGPRNVLRSVQMQFSALQSDKVTLTRMSVAPSIETVSHYIPYITLRLKTKMFIDGLY